jgi:hypothetical protein
MFSDGSDRRAADYLRSHPGRRVCYACLTHELGITHDQVRRASWRLRDEAGCSIRPARCAVCARRRVTIALDGSGAPPGPCLSSPPVPQPVEAVLVETLAQHLRDRSEEGAAVLAPRRVIDVLIQAAGTPYCASCVAFATDLPLADARTLLQSLAGVSEFRHADAACGTCGRWQMTLSFRHNGATGAERPDELAAARARDSIDTRADQDLFRCG